MHIASFDSHLVNGAGCGDLLGIHGVHQRIDLAHGLCGHQIGTNLLLQTSNCLADGWELALVSSGQRFRCAQRTLLT
jgi:hypothetical protein